MPNYTPIYNLKKPLGTENYNVEDQNGNMDLIESAIKTIDEKASNITIPVTKVNGKTGDVILSATDIKAADGTTLEDFKGSATSQLADKTNKNDYVANTGYAVTAGIGTAYTITLNPAPTAYQDGQQFIINPHVVCGANPTLNINNLGAGTILNQDGSAVSAGDIPANKPLSLVRVGSNFFIRSSAGGGQFKLFTGTATPAEAVDGDIWVKQDGITINKTVFDKDFSLTNSYPDGSLVFYITSNPADQGYKMIVDLFNRTSKIDMLVPLFISAFYKGGAWQYPVVYIRNGGVWKYLSGTFIDSNIAIYAFANLWSISPYNLELNKYSLDGTNLITNAHPVVGGQNMLVQAAFTHPIDGRKYVLFTANGSTSTVQLFIFDKDGNYVSKLTLTGGSSFTGSIAVCMIADSAFLYIMVSGSVSGTIGFYKIDITNNTQVIGKTISTFTNVWPSAKSLICQDDNYIYISNGKIAKSDGTGTTVANFVAGKLKITDKQGRILELSAPTTTSISVKIINPTDLSVIKTVTIPIDYTLGSTTSLGRVTIDKDDNLIIMGYGTSATITTASTWATKLNKDSVNNTWTLLISTMFYNSTTGNDGATTFEADIFGDIFTTKVGAADYGLLKLNPNLQIVFDYTNVGSMGNDQHVAIEPCDVRTDYKRQYYK